jgi:hypothetical protein
VKPGEAPPASRDLLTEATLPFEERGTQKRYTQLSRFNIYLPPVGKVTLPGPEVWRVDESLNGLYQILLRIEASDDKYSDSDTGAVGGGPAVVHGGAVAGFSLPALRYYVSNGGVTRAPTTITLLQLAPDDQAVIVSSVAVDFLWTMLEKANVYRVEVEDLQSTPVISAILPAGVGSYRAPPWLQARAGNRLLRWRVLAFDAAGKELDHTPWRVLKFEAAQVK